MLPKSAVYFSASSRLPHTIPTAEIFDTVNVGFVIDSETGEILEATSTLTSKGANEFLQFLAKGFNLHTNDSEQLIDLMRTKYFGWSQKAVIVASKAALKRYYEWRDLKK